MCFIPELVLIHVCFIDLVHRLGWRPYALAGTVNSDLQQPIGTPRCTYALCKPLTEQLYTASILKETIHSDKQWGEIMVLYNVVILTSMILYWYVMPSVDIFHNTISRPHYDSVKEKKWWGKKQQHWKSERLWISSCNWSITFYQYVYLVLTFYFPQGILFQLVTVVRWNYNGVINHIAVNHDI